MEHFSSDCPPSTSLFSRCFPLLLLLLVLLTARFSAFYLSRQGYEQVQAVISFVENRMESKPVPPKDRVQFLLKYGIGLADTMIRFENIPKDIAPTFLYISSCLTSGISVEELRFEGRMVEMDLRADSVASVQNFQEQLTERNYFSQVIGDTTAKTSILENSSSDSLDSQAPLPPFSRVDSVHATIQCIL